MRLGATQRRILAYLERCGPAGGYIGITTRAPELLGHQLEEVERSLRALERRGVVRRVGVRHVIVRHENVDPESARAVRPAAPS